MGATGAKSWGKHMKKSSIHTLLRLCYPSLKQNASQTSMLPSFVSVCSRKLDNTQRVMETWLNKMGLLCRCVCAVHASILLGLHVCTWPLRTTSSMSTRSEQSSCSNICNYKQIVNCTLFVCTHLPMAKVGHADFASCEWAPGDPQEDDWHPGWDPGGPGQECFCVCWLICLAWGLRIIQNIWPLIFVGTVSRSCRACSLSAQSLTWLSTILWSVLGQPLS